MITHLQPATPDSGASILDATVFGLADHIENDHIENDHIEADHIETDHIETDPGTAHIVKFSCRVT